MNNETHENHNVPPVAEGNIGRLLGEAYKPVEPEASLTSRIEGRMVTAAAGAKGFRGTLPRPTGRRLLRIPLRFWAAAMVLIAVNIGTTTSPATEGAVVVISPGVVSSR